MDKLMKERRERRKDTGREEDREGENCLHGLNC
jgi:hypothetical protein